MTEVRWRVTDQVPDEDLPLRCDLCGAPADTLHLVGVNGAAVRSQRGEQVDVDAVLACPRHDAGGYWMSLDRVFHEPGYGTVGINNWIEHFRDRGGPDQPYMRAFMRFLDRLEAARREVAEADASMPGGSSIPRARAEEPT